MAPSIWKRFVDSPSTGDKDDFNLGRQAFDIESGFFPISHYFEWMISNLLVRFC